MSTNPLIELHAYGQSFWYDNIRRRYLRDGTLQNLIDHDGLRGMTSNPSIFQKAIGDSDDYDAQMRQLIAAGADTATIYEELAISDIREACDIFAQLYRASDGRDGFVSLEVSPYLARDTTGTIAEAKRLHAAVGRPNLMIKVPATVEGIPAIGALLGEGINVNVTLMFNMAHFEAVARAYLDGARTLLERGGDAAHIAAVASFFVSRVDTAVDKELVTMDRAEAAALLGKAAIANARVVYRRFKEIFHGPDFADLRRAGVPVQRLLWASTSTKNPAYSDTRYVDELIGPETVNTMPPVTIAAFRDRGTVANTLEGRSDEAQEVLQDLAGVGIDLAAITERLQVDGVNSFAASFDKLLAAIEQKRETLVAPI